MAVSELRCATKGRPVAPIGVIVHLFDPGVNTPGGYRQPGSGGNAAVTMRTRVLGETTLGLHELQRCCPRASDATRARHFLSIRSTAHQSRPIRSGFRPLRRTP